MPIPIYLETAHLCELAENNTEFFKDLKYLDFNVFKSGSVGQVHKGIYKNDEHIIFKVQYLGLYEQFKSEI